MQAETIDDVINKLGRQIARHRDVGSPRGYFPALYRRVTINVKRAIEHGLFDDGPRMERLDAVFANFYFRACDAWQHGKQCSDAWKVPFRAAADWPPVVLQHLLLGINAHINLDLGIATAEVARDGSLPALRADFDRINAILAAVTAEAKNELAAIWPLLRVFDTFAGNLQEGFIHFSLVRAREHAWWVAQQLTQMNETSRPDFIAQVDHRTASLGCIIWKPPLRTRILLLGVRLGERGTVPRNIDRLMGSN